MADAHFKLNFDDDEPIDGAAIATIDFAAPEDAPYIPEEHLKYALKNAVLLGRPLLLTGEPGTGKTRLAHWVARKLRCTLRTFETKSTSQAKDLFYTYDSLAAFKHQSVAGEAYDARAFIQYQALGAAILDAFPSDNEAVKSLRPDMSADPGAMRKGKRSVVLIDEIDKAPRDFPNDLLNEIERLYFRVPELGNQGSPGADPGQAAMQSKLRPIIIMTSNEERGLPDAFRRRCIYHEIPFPARGEPGKKGQLDLIVEAHFATLRFDPPMLKCALDLFYGLRDGAFDKKPSTAELIDWLQILLVLGAVPEKPLADQLPLVEQTLCVLAKTGADAEAARHYVRNVWPRS